MERVLINLAGWQERRRCSTSKPWHHKNNFNHQFHMKNERVLSKQWSFSYDPKRSKEQGSRTTTGPDETASHFLWGISSWFLLPPLSSTFPFHRFHQLTCSVFFLCPFSQSETRSQNLGLAFFTENKCNLSRCFPERKLGSLTWLRGRDIERSSAITACYK